MSGYKTYILAFMAVIAALFGWYTGALTVPQALELVSIGGFAATFRSALAALHDMIAAKFGASAATAFDTIAQAGENAVEAKLGVSK